MRNLPYKITNKRRIVPLRVYSNLNLIVFPEDITNAWWDRVSVPEKPVPKFLAIL